MPTGKPTHRIGAWVCTHVGGGDCGWVESSVASAKPDRWELRTCGRRGHVTYQPQESDLADRLQAATAVGQAWRCLRCGDFVVGAPQGGGPADRAPLIL